MNEKQLHPNRFQVARAFTWWFLSQNWFQTYAQVSLGQIGLESIWDFLLAFTWQPNRLESVPNRFQSLMWTGYVGRFLSTHAILIAHRQIPVTYVMIYHRLNILVLCCDVMRCIILGFSLIYTDDWYRMALNNRVCRSCLGSGAPFIYALLRSLYASASSLHPSTYYNVSFANVPNYLQIDNS